MTTMKKLFLICARVTLILTLLFSVYSSAHALDYTVLTPLPGTTSCGNDATGKNCTATFTSYLPGLFKLAIGVAAVLAFVMITFGGLTYMTSDAIQGKEDGRGMVTNALYGLILVIGAYAILYTINPQILNFQLSIPQPNVKYGSTSAIVFAPITADQVAATNANAAKLGPNIYTAHGTCQEGATTNCVTLDGLQNKTIDGITALQTKCNCKIVITGGTEDGHSTTGSHPTGNGLDIQSDPQVIQSITGSTNPPTACVPFPVPGGGTAIYEVAGSKCGGPVGSSGPHFHISYPCPAGQTTC